MKIYIKMKENAENNIQVISIKDVTSIEYDIKTDSLIVEINDYAWLFNRTEIDILNLSID